MRRVGVSWQLCCHLLVVPEMTGGFCAFAVGQLCCHDGLWLSLTMETLSLDSSSFVFLFYFIVGFILSLSFIFLLFR